MTLPSKELLSAVLGRKVSSHQVAGSPNDLAIGFENGVSYSSFDMCINIYELAYKCKEWVWKSYLITIRSGYAEFGGWSNFVHNNVSFCSMDIPFTEPEAVFLACEWILKEMKR